MSVVATCRRRGFHPAGGRRRLLAHGVEGRLRDCFKRSTQLEKALKAGAKAWDVEDSRLLAREIANLTPEQLAEYRLGLTSRLFAKLRSAATNRDEAGRLLNMSQALEDKIRVVFGDQATFDAFMRRVNVEGELAKLRSAVAGSQTARRLQARGFDPAELGADLATHVAVGGVHGVIHSAKTLAGRALKGSIERGTAREMGPMLMTQGASGTDALLRTLQQRDPLLGAIATRALPAVGSRGVSSPFDD